MIIHASQRLQMKRNERAHVGRRLMSNDDDDDAIDDVVYD